MQQGAGGAIPYPHTAYAARHFGADGNAVASYKIAIRNAYVFGGLGHKIAFGVLARFNGNAVVAGTEGAIENAGVGGSVGVYAIAVVNAVGDDGQIMAGDVVAVDVMNDPAGRLREGNRSAKIS